MEAGGAGAKGFCLPRYHPIPQHIHRKSIMENNRNDIINFSEITGRIAWENILDEPKEEGSDWTWPQEWNKRISQMGIKDKNGKTTTFRLSPNEDWALIHNPITGNHRVIWRTEGFERMFIADGKPLTFTSQTDTDGNLIRTITTTTDGTSKLTGAWPLAMADEAARDAITQAADDWAAANGKLRYSTSSRKRDGGFFPMIPRDQGLISGFQEWTDLTRDLAYWKTLMMEAKEGGHDLKNITGDMISHKMDMDW